MLDFITSKAAINITIETIILNMPSNCQKFLPIKIPTKIIIDVMLSLL